MRKRMLLTTVVATLAVVAVAFTFWTHVPPNPKAVYTRGEVRVLNAMAAAGDMTATRRLYFHALFVRQDWKEAERWLIYGADRGHVRSMVDLCAWYGSIGSPLYSRGRAVACMERLERVAPSEGCRLLDGRLVVVDDLVPMSKRCAEGRRR